MSKMPERVGLAHLPTPLEPWRRLSRDYGLTLYAKRDDYTGSEISGNKVRKLEFAVAEALQQGADMLVTCGGLQSNHARATAVAAVKAGIKSCLILRGNPEEQPDGNYLLDLLLGARIKFVTPEQYAHEIEAVFQETKAELAKEGYKPYIIPEGASNGIGTFGYAAAIEEITKQEQELGITFNKIVVATGSGGTQAGLLLGTKLQGQNREIYGVNVGGDAPYFINRIDRILAEAQEYLDAKLTIDRSEIRILEGYVGPGYGLNDPAHLAVIKEVAQLEGLILDPVYTGKAMTGLLAEIRKGQHFTAQDNVLFIHTGGHFGIFPVKERF